MPRQWLSAHCEAHSSMAPHSGQPASVRDRTPEFLLLCERLQRQLGSTGQALQHAAGNGLSGSGPHGAAQLQPNKSQILQQHSDFARKAAEIGHGIHKTSLKLQKLAQLAKRTSMFDDPAQEVDELTGLIKQDIQGINTSIAELQRVSARGGRQGEASKQSVDHSHTVVDNLRTRLKDATQEFKDVLTIRTDNLKHHKERRQLFSSDAAEVSMPLLRPTPMHQQQQQHSSSSAAAADPGGHMHQTQHHQQQVVPSFLQSQQMQLSAPQDNYLSSRAVALRNVETTIVELGTIFNKLSEMVAQQGELAIRIDENVDDTLANVTSAQAQLVKYWNSISTNRWLVLKVLGVLFIFLIFFITVVA